MTHALDYPSHREGVLAGLSSAPQPLLLDTSTLQHLKLVWNWKGEEDRWTSDELKALDLRYGKSLADELLALCDLRRGLPHAGNGHPWLVSITSLHEFERTNSEKGRELTNWWQAWADHWEDWALAYQWPGVEIKKLWSRASEVHPGQLSFSFKIKETWAAPWLARFRDAGDRSLIFDALRAGVKGILTTDVRTFWRFRQDLFGRGLEVWRPTDLWESFFGDARRRPEVYLTHPVIWLATPSDWLPRRSVSESAAGSGEPKN